MKVKSPLDRFVLFLAKKKSFKRIYVVTVSLIVTLKVLYQLNILDVNTFVDQSLMVFFENNSGIMMNIYAIFITFYISTLFFVASSNKDSLNHMNNSDRILFFRLIKNMIFLSLVLLVINIANDQNIIMLISIFLINILYLILNMVFFVYFVNNIINKITDLFETKK